MAPTEILQPSVGLVPAEAKKDGPAGDPAAFRRACPGGGETCGY
jgi:hypothetical protein